MVPENLLPVPPDVGDAAPSATVAVGSFGDAYLKALNLALPWRPYLDRLGLVHVSCAGWNMEEVSEPDRHLVEPEQWLRENRGPGMQALQDAIRKAQQKAGSSTKETDIYIICHLNEIFTQQILPILLAMVREAHPPTAGCVITLILALDSLELKDLTEEEAARWRTLLVWLKSELEAAVDPDEPSGRIGWCYLLDAYNTYGHPLHPPTGISDSSCAQEVQAHYAVEFLALLIAGLRQSPLYISQNLAAWQRDIQRGQVTAWVSSFAAASYLFPVEALAQRAQTELSLHLLNATLDGPDKPTDNPMARALSSDWIAQMQLERAQLRKRLLYDEHGRPFEFRIHPPDVRAIPDMWVIDRLLSWEALLSQQWQAPEAYADQIAQRATEIGEGAVDSLSEKFENQLSRSPNGGQIAARLLREANDAIIAAQAHTEKRPVPLRWLTRLLAAVSPPTTEPAASADLEDARRRLARALSRRVNRRAVWTRAGMQGIALSAFVWALYLATAHMSTLQGMVVRLVDFSGWPVALASALDLLALAVISWIVALLIGGWRIARTEGAIQRETAHFIDAMRHKFVGVQELLLQEQTDRVYEIVRQGLQAWQPRIMTRQGTLSIVRELLESELRADWDPAPLLTEVLMPDSDWQRFLPKISQRDISHWAEGFLAAPQRTKWEHESADELATALKEEAVRRLELWKRNLGLTRLAEQLRPTLPTQWLETLKEKLYPALPLAREERAALAFPSQPVRYRRANGRYADPLALTHFIGQPIGGDYMAETMQDVGRESKFTTAEPGRLAFVAILHGIELDRLRLWQLLSERDPSQTAEEGSPLRETVR